jgi:hypothetical protein
VNSALQCLLHAVPPLAAGLFAAPAQLLRGGRAAALRSLRALLLALAAGPHASVDPTHFAACLQLDHSVQQAGPSLGSSWVGSDWGLVGRLGAIVCCLAYVYCCAISQQDLLNGQAARGQGVWTFV